MISDSILQSIVYTPVGQEIRKGEITQKDALDMIECLQELHTIGALHRNCVDKHFMRCPKTGKIFLIDFGRVYFFKNDSPMIHGFCTSVHNDDSYDCWYSGTNFFAPMEVYEHLIGQRYPIIHLSINYIYNSNI